MTTFEKLIATPEGRTALCVEQTITNVTELLCELLAKHKGTMNRTKLAEFMEVTPGRITQLLDGQANMTLKSVARALAAFNCVLEVSYRSVSDVNSQPLWHLHSAPSTFEIVGRTVETNRPLSGKWIAQPFSNKAG